MDTGGLFTLGHSFAAEVALVGGDWYISILPLVAIDLPRADFCDLDPPLSDGEAVLHLAGYLAGMAAGAVFVIDQ